jgi:hypothetical protein
MRLTLIKLKTKNAKIKKLKIEKTKTKKANTTKKSKTTTKLFSKIKSMTKFSRFERIFFERERINRESTYNDFLFLLIFYLHFRSRLIILIDLRKKTKDFVSRMNRRFVIIIDKK